MQNPAGRAGGVLCSMVEGGVIAFFHGGLGMAEDLAGIVNFRVRQGEYRFGIY